MAKAKKEESTSNALVVVTPEEQAYLDSLDSNADKPKVEYTGPNKLIINVGSKDSEGVKRTIGSWHIQNTDKYFDGVVEFRPIRYAFKLVKYNQDSAGKWTTVGQSIYFNDFSDQILDTLGGLALGRKFGAKYSTEEKASTRKLAETYLDIFGLVKFGDDDWQEVLYRVRGSKIITMLNAFKSLPKDKKYSQYSYKIETFQPEGQTYWDITIEPDMSQVLSIGSVLEYDGRILDNIRENNDYVLKEHTKNRTSNLGNDLASTAKTKTSKIIDEDDMEIPF